MYSLIIIITISVIIYLYVSYRPVLQEAFSNEYVLSNDSSLTTYLNQTPDLDWKEFEANMKDQLVKEGEEKEQEDEIEKDMDDEETEMNDAEEDGGNFDMVKELIKRRNTTVLEKEKVTDEIKKDDENEFSMHLQVEKEIRKADKQMKSDEKYLLQHKMNQKKPSPRFLPKFSNDLFHVYDPETTPPLRYATRPGPNTFNDILSQRAHIETQAEKVAAKEAQANAQMRHNDLLRRQNWVYNSVNNIRPDYILRQPKMIPGPANEIYYTKRYSKLKAANI